MAGFIQIIEFKTSRFDEVQKLSDEMSSREPGETDPTRVTVSADRDRPNTYITIAEFPSYEIAMKNSNRPETSEFSAKMAELCDGPATFYNLDLVYER